VDEARRAELRRWAKAIADASDSADARAAARAVGLLLDDVERLEGELESVQKAESRDGKPRRRRGKGPAVGVLIVALLSAIAAFGPRALAPDLAAAGPGSGDRIGAVEAKRLVFAVTGDAEAIEHARWRVDGTDVTGRARLEGGRTELWGSYLRDGEHKVEVVVPRDFPRFAASHSWRVSIDRTPPRLAVDPASARAARDAPLTLRGLVEEDSAVSVGGRAATVHGTTFALPLPAPSEKPIELVATDAYGNKTWKTVRIAVIPRRPPAPLRAVHVTFYAWADRDLHRGVMSLVDEGRVDAVELDLKDESGIVGWDADTPFAKRIGSVQAIYDLPRAVALLHRKGVRVVGRIVAFRDPIHAAAAWKRGWKSQVVQTPDGGPYSGYGGFTNFADPVVRQYNVDIARRAAEAGVDEILYDYVRRPDGPIGSMSFPGLAGSLERSIASFLGDAHRQLKPYRVFLGASVFGIAATRPTEVAQPIRAIARNVDYVAPMVYPSHWAPGEYDVASPNSQPYEIVFRSLQDFRKQTRGTGARVVPWLQDFSFGVEYGPAEVRAQIRAAAARGIDEWLLWDPLVTYTSDALDRHPRRPPITTKPPAARPLPAPAAPAALPANELGVVPVLMHHQIRADGGGDYDLTPAQFRGELARLWREGYVPIRAADLVSGRIDVPAGKTPVVMSFDDSTKEQLAWDADEDAEPDTAVGIMLAFARRHPGFRPAGTFYVNNEPFGGVREGAEMLRWLHDNGFELGNHTYDHIPFSQLSAREIRRQLALGKKLIVDAVPGAAVTTLALPLGALSKPASIARAGEWNGIAYRNDGVFLVGAEPAPSPFSSSFDPGAIPRIRTSPGELGSTYWLDELARHPERRYVSDGDPATISFPRALSDRLAQRFASRARPS
jgi:hypothetical protein